MCIFEIADDDIPIAGEFLGMPGIKSECIRNFICYIQPLALQ